MVLKARWSAAGEHLAVGEDGVIAVRPEVIGLWPVGPRAAPISTCARPGQVRNRIYLGDHTEFSVHVPELGELMVRLPKSDPLAMRPAAGRCGGDRLARRAGAGAARHLNGIPGARPATRPAARKNQDVVCAEEANMDRKDFIKQLRRYQKGSISRRHFLGVTGLGTATAVLAASMPHLMTAARLCRRRSGRPGQPDHLARLSRAEELREVHGRDRRQGQHHRVRLQRRDVRQAEGGRHRLGRAGADQLHDRDLCRRGHVRAARYGACCRTTTRSPTPTPRFTERGNGRRQDLCRAQGLGHHRLSSSIQPR